MGSKYRANIGLNQIQMDSLADKFPEINDILKFPTFASILQHVLGKVIKGDLVSKTVNSGAELDDKIKEQKYLQLCLQNWKGLKENGTIFEEAKAIILGQKQLNAPSMQPLLEGVAPAPHPEGLTELSYCHSCQHYHFGDAPRKCKTDGCNCGVRG